ncbi:hypothetical protein NDU88_012213 [Pleurodeles waltl]|uniref:Uncharacterized protein n=1 Tax=Pleurodeles waltl TaxID=8319 RepID=A0AAV7R390_PLEWA|nr:hypothetical protein NDU88_012213 [Pleurodeles waltl]
MQWLRVFYLQARDLTIGDGGAPTINGSDTTRRPQCTSPGPRHTPSRHTLRGCLLAIGRLTVCPRLRQAPYSSLIKKAVRVTRRPCRALLAAPSGVAAPKRGAASVRRRSRSPPLPEEPRATQCERGSSKRRCPTPSQSFLIYGTHPTVQPCAASTHKR